MSAPIDARVSIERFKVNPIIMIADDSSNMVSSVFNLGDIVFEGRTLLPVRVAHRTRQSSLTVASSDDGHSDGQIDPKLVE